MKREIKFRRLAPAILAALAFLPPTAAEAVAVPGGAAVQQRADENRRHAIAGDWLARLRGAFVAAEAAVRDRDFAEGPVDEELADWTDWGFRGRYCGDALVVWLDRDPPALGRTAPSRLAARGAHRTQAGNRVSLRGETAALPACMAGVVPAGRPAVHAEIAPQELAEARNLREERRTLACPEGREGNGIVQVRYLRAGPGPDDEPEQALGWTTVRDECTNERTLRTEGTGRLQIRHRPCGAGWTGLVTEERSGHQRRLLNRENEVLQTRNAWGDWQATGNNCRLSAGAPRRAGGQTGGSGSPGEPSDRMVWRDDSGGITVDPDRIHRTEQVSPHSLAYQEFERKGLERRMAAQQARQQREARQRSRNSGDDNDRGRSGGGGGGGGGGASYGGSGTSESGGYCFGAGTLVLMADGSRKPIEDVRLGDILMAFDGLGELEPRAVIGRREQIRDVVSLGGTLVTPDHKFLQPDGSFLAVGTIAPDGSLVLADGTDAPMPLLVPIGPMPVYDITVEGLSTYVANGWRVHNW